MLKKYYGQHLLKRIPTSLFKHFDEFVYKTSLSDKASVYKSDLQNQDSKHANVFNLIIEIGPGKGALTRPILKKIKEISARTHDFSGNTANTVFWTLALIEIDEDMVDFLNLHVQEWGGTKDLEAIQKGKIYTKIYQADAVNFDYQNLVLELGEEVLGSGFWDGVMNNKMSDSGRDVNHVPIKDSYRKDPESYWLNIYFIGALPYNVSKPIILNVFKQVNCFYNTQETKLGTKFKLGQVGYTFIVQKEVAELFVNTTPNASLLSNVRQFCGFSANIGCTLAPKWFAPPPKVYSSCFYGNFGKTLNAPIKEYEIDIYGMEGHGNDCLACDKFADFLGLFFHYQRKTIRKIIVLLRKNSKISNQQAQDLFAQAQQLNIAQLRPSQVSYKDWLKLFRIFL